MIDQQLCAWIPVILIHGKLVSTSKLISNVCCDVHTVHKNDVVLQYAERAAVEIDHA